MREIRVSSERVNDSLAISLGLISFSYLVCLIVYDVWIWDFFLISVYDVCFMLLEHQIRVFDLI